MQQQLDFNMENKQPNEQQKKCIDFRNGILLALAGPGTGKTFSISRRIKSLTEEGVEPEKILCLTYTDTAANEMRKAVSKIIDETTAQKVNISTYHSLCLNIIEDNKDDFSNFTDNNIKTITETTKYKIAKECIDELGITTYGNSKNNPYKKIKELINGIADIKKNLIKKESFFNNLENHPEWGGKLKAKQKEKEENILNNKKITKALENEITSTKEKIQKAEYLWNFYELYNLKTKERSLIDFEDMLTIVLNKFEQDEVFVKKVASNYTQILVDEYQDTSKIQNNIIFHLIDNMQKKNAFVVGDDDQTIYSFQGAHIDNIEKFIEKYSYMENFDVVCLEENRRSTEQILNFSYEISKSDALRLEDNPKFKKFNINKKLKAKNEKLYIKNKPPKFTLYATTEREINAIIEQIEKIINSDKCPKENGEKKLNEIAIFSKSNNELKIYAEKLKAKNIPFELKEGKSIFEIKSSIMLCTYLKLLANPALYENNAFKLFLEEPFKLNQNDYFILWSMRHKKNDQLFIENLKDGLKENKFEDFNKIKSFIETFESLQKLSQNESLRTVILSAAQKTGIYNYFVNSEINRTENIAGLKAILQCVNDFSQTGFQLDIESFIDYLDLSKENDLTIKTEKPPIALNAIQLSTYHSSKGREFEYVFMPNLQKGIWESNNKSNELKIPTEEIKDKEERKKIKISNETKLMFVGITRAKHSLYLSCSENSRWGITEIIKPYLNLTEYKVEEFDNKLYVSDMLQELEKKDFNYQNEYKNLIKNILKDLTYSPTSINTYINCPKQFLYSYILKLDTKSDYKDEANYGTAMHYAAQKAFKFAKENNCYPNKDFLKDCFKKKFDDLIISDKFNRKFLEERAEKNIDNFYTQFISTPISRLIDCECFLKEIINGIKITGIIDRIELNDDETFTIADYKTGYNKKASDVKINGEKQDYLIQLILYKEMYEKKTNKKVTKLKIILPDEPEKSFEIPFDEKIKEDVLNIFKETYKNINQLKFEKTGNKNNCKYCAYKDLCTATN